MLVIKTIMCYCCVQQALLLVVQRAELDALADSKSELHHDAPGVRAHGVASAMFVSDVLTVIIVVQIKCTQAQPSHTVGLLYAASETRVHKQGLRSLHCLLPLAQTAASRHAIAWALHDALK